MNLIPRNRSVAAALFFLTTCAPIGAQGPTGAALDFSAASPGSVADSTGQGTGFPARLPLTGGSFTGNDPNLTLNTVTRTLSIRSTAADTNGSGNLQIAEFPGFPLASFGISTGSDMLVRATFTNIQVSQNYDQFGIFIGADAKNLVRGGVLRANTTQLFTSLTVPSELIGIDTGQQFSGTAAPGDTLVMTLGRVSGQWFFAVENRTTPANSRVIPVSLPSMPETNLFAGIFAANPGNATQKIEVVTDFYTGKVPSSAISFFGADTSTHGAWRTSNVSKAADGDGNNIYGTDGYVLTGTNPTVSNPNYAVVTRLTSLAFPGNGGYIFVDNPVSAGTVLSGVWYEQSGNAVEHDFARLTFSKFVKTRVGILISNTDIASISPDNLRIRQTAGGSADSGLIPSPVNQARNGDWYFFDIDARPGDAYIVSGTNALPHASNGIGAVTFDSISASAVSITTTSISNGVVGTSYSSPVSATGGTPPYSWAATNLPAGLSISPTVGTISGTPTASGTFSPQVTVTDARSASASKTFSVTISPALTITTSSLGSALQESPYSAQMSAVNGTAPYTWTATGLAPGLSMSTSGAILGTPSQAGNFSVTVQVTDSVHATATRTFTFVVAPNFVPLYVTGSGSLGSTSVGKPAGSGSFSASGGKAPYSWSLAGAPSGISLSASGSSATVGGTPQQAGSFNFSVTVTDGQGQRASANGSISVLGLNIGGLPDGTAFSPYSGSISAVGGAPPYSFKVTGLPPGMAVGGDGSLRGTPQKDGTFNLGVDVSDSGGNTTSGFATLTIAPAPVLKISGNTPAGAIQTPYSASLSASGGGTPYVFSIAGGSLPDGVRMSSSGSFSGTPTAPGTFTFTARVTDAAGTSATSNFSITIAPPPLTISAPSPLPAGMVTVDYPSQTLTASGGIAPYTFKLSGGNAPGGISVSDTGSVAGTPTASGSFTFNVTATDASGLTASASLSMEVRPLTGDIILSEGTLGYTVAAGSATLPGGSTVRVQSTDVNRSLGWSAATTTPWITLNGASGSTPGAFEIALNAGAAALTPAATPYSGTVVVTCSSGPCAGRTQSVTVNAKVESQPPQLSVSASSLSFRGIAANPVALTQSVTIRNTGGGTLGVGSVACGASWCHTGSAPATLPAGASATIDVVVDALPAGYYWSQIDIVTSGGKATVPVTYYVAGNPSVTLAPSGFTTSVPAGGAVSGPAAGFFVTVQDGSSASWTASIQQGDFLRLGSPSGVATPAAPGRINFSFDGTAVAALTPGTYYGTIRVAATGVANSPQDFTVVLNVTPATDRPKPTPSPAGLVFFSSAAAPKGSQSVSLYSSSPTAVTFQASSSTEDGTAWLSVSPAAGSTSAAATAETTVSADASALKPGVYRGLINYAFAAAGVRSVNVTLVVPAPTAVTLLQPRADGCVAKQIVPTQTGLVSNFAAPAAWPVPLEVSLINDCGDAIASGQVVTTFSNGDPPLALSLADPKTGRYVATWTPRKASSQTSITALASASGFPGATIKFSGAVTPNNAPILNKDAVLNIYNPVGGVPAAPGTLVSIKGQYLASQPITNTKVPLPTVLGGTSVVIGGLKAPIASVSPTQVNVQVPAELPTGQPYQVVISANGALTTPDGLQMADTSPGLSLLPTGFVNATHQSGGVVTEAVPAKPGEQIVIYLAGMGLTKSAVASGEASPTEATQVANPPEINLDGLPVSFDFAGLTPGLVGVYQINMTVPETAKSGNLTLSLTQAGIPSNSGLLPVKK